MAPDRAPESKVHDMNEEQVLDMDEYLEWEGWDGSTPFWKHAVAGSCAGITEHLAMYPLDTVKTHMQVLRPDGGPPPRMSQILRSIAAEHGSFGVMRGASAIVSGCIPAHTALFCTYEWTKSRLLYEDAPNEHVRAAFCGAAASFSHDLILTPMDVVKQRLQLGCYSGTLNCLACVSKSEGIGALYRSMPITLFMNIPFNSVLVAANEHFKRLLGLRQDVPAEEARSNLPWYFFSAGCSGALAAALTQPLDVVKTRLQTQDVLAHQASTAIPPQCSKASAMEGAPQCRREEATRIAPRYKGFAACVTDIFKSEGPHGFFRGMLPRMFYSAPSAAMCWGTYEVLKNVLRPM